MRYPRRSHLAPTAALLSLLATLLNAPGHLHAETKDFAEGVRIDWDNVTVEADATVVLREGPLELIACTRGTREHESIVVIKADPEKLFMAMGLIGLEPGRPVRYDEKAGKLLPATGQPLSIEVAYKVNDETRRHPVFNWTITTEGDHVPESAGWVFAGSRRLPNKQLAVANDGTVICVVDFESALITVNALHTADNDALWLMANPDTVPPTGTPCTLIIAAATCDRAVTVAPDGKLSLQGKPATAADLVRQAQDNSGCRERFVLTPATDTEAATLDRVKDALRKAGIPAKRITVAPPAANQDTTPPQDPGSTQPSGSKPPTGTP